MILIALTFLILFLFVLIYLCSFIKITIIKEIILYPVLVFSVVISSIITFPSSFYRPTLFIYFIGTSLFGIIFHYFIMKKIDDSTCKIDIYIYIYTLFQVYTILHILNKKSPYFMLYLSLGIIFYLINISCFYYFKRDKLLKIIVMPSIVSGLCFFPMGLRAFLFSIG